MKVEKIVKEYETIYIAENGTEFDTERRCKEYEELLKDPSPLKALKFFDSKGNPLDVFALGDIPCFSYLVIEDNEIKKYHWTVIKAIIGSKNNDENSYDLPFSKGVYLNDWTAAYEGSYGRNGWKLQESIEHLEYRIESCKNKIELLKKITKPLDK